MHPQLVDRGVFSVLSKSIEGYRQARSGCDVLAGYHFTGPRQQDREYLKGLLLKLDARALISAQLPRALDLKNSKASLGRSGFQGL